MCGEQPLTRARSRFRGDARCPQDHTLGSKGIMCVWDLSSAARGPQLQGATPSAVLVSEGSPACCCWAPAPSTSLVFAGTAEMERCYVPPFLMRKQQETQRWGNRARACT